MAREFGRPERVADFLLKELSILIQREMRDPRVAMVSITEVEVSRDLSHAKVYLTAIGCDSKEDAKEPIKVLNGAAGFLRSQLAKGSTMRTTPTLRFYFDESQLRAGHIENLLRDIRSEKPSGDQ